ncbi:Mitochondrial editing factor 21 [Heracleum sosnowskyi]|uniref:Mitochondrial editing factor 21 n=1 Tax=Heracleum sosnowskyi TaxID=360622 RepID=A0AAD8J1P4_9APIA|nr:Mitochondrial editing factor 21 [Heracleum sosnowskyi]
MTTNILTTRILENMFVPMLQNCVSIAKLKKIHAQILKFSLSQSNFLVTKMVDVCDHNGEINYVNLLFKEVINPNTHLYNAVIRAYTHNHLYVLTVSMFKQMLRHPHGKDPIFPDKFTYPFVIKSCGGLISHGLGTQVHGHVFKKGLLGIVVIENSLLNMYLKCDNVIDAHNLFGEMRERDVISWNGLICGHVKLGQMKKAKVVFEEMPVKSIVTWTAMISGYTRIGCYADALDVFRRMQMVGVKPDWVSLVAVLRACSQLGALELGKWIHFYADKNGFLGKTCICNALIEMYAKCGSINEALLLFNVMCERDVISWSTMIMGLSNHGKAGEAIQVFREMERAKVEPNAITFVGLLSACAHAGFLDEGLNYFELMRNEYNIEPGIEHYGCLIDLLGRTGCFERALELVKDMPMKPDSAIWGSLLSSCRIHGNLDTAVIAMEHLVELEPDDTGNYVLLSNIYATLGKWDAVSRLRKIIRSKSLKKTPGCSMIEVDNTVQEFVSGDDSKPFSNDLYWMLELINLQDKTDNEGKVTLQD